MAFTLDRIDAAKMLGVSTRTIDRYIQADRIHVKRIGKKIWLNRDDLDILRTEDPTRTKDDYVVILNDESEKQEKAQSHSPALRTFHDQSIDMMRLYDIARATIEKKDEVIQDLSYRLGKSENELKNSIPLAEYKKATFLLESSIQKGETESQLQSDKIKSLENDVNKKNGLIFGLAILTSMILIFSVVFFLYIKVGLPT